MTFIDEETGERASTRLDERRTEGCSGEAGFSPHFELVQKYVNGGNYQSLLLNERTMSMEMVLDGGIFVSLDVEDSFALKRDYYLSK